MRTPVVLSVVSKCRGLGPRASFGFGELCPLSCGFGLVAEGTTPQRVVLSIHSLVVHTWIGSDLESEIWYHSISLGKSMLLLFGAIFLMFCIHFRTCCACTCKDYVCRHSQPGHFGSSLPSRLTLKDPPTHTSDGCCWFVSTAAGGHSRSFEGRHSETQFPSKDLTDGKTSPIPDPAQAGGGRLHNY